MNFVRGNVAQDSLKIEIQKVAHRGHVQKWPKIAKITFLRDMSFLELRTGDNNHPLITVRGEDVHLYPVILNPKEFAKRMYNMASRVSQSRSFYSCEKSFFLLLKSTQNHLKRTANHFFLEKIHLKKTFNWAATSKIFEKKNCSNWPKVVEIVKITFFTINLRFRLL